MNRSFRRFLGCYLEELSGMRTSSLRRLCAEAHSNARLVEPLLLFAAEQGKTSYLVSLSEGAWFHDDYSRVSADIAQAPSVQKYLESGNAPKRYAAVLDAFLAQGDALAADRRMNALMRSKISAALTSRGMTRYRLCKDLGLNAGNVYAYLAGDDAKVSNETARRILEYALQRA